jgi:hypothetical protein
MLWKVTRCTNFTMKAALFFFALFLNPSSEFCLRLSSLWNSGTFWDPILAHLPILCLTVTNHSSLNLLCAAAYCSVNHHVHYHTSRIACETMPFLPAEAFHCLSIAGATLFGTRRAIYSNDSIGFNLHQHHYLSKNSTQCAESDVSEISAVRCLFGKLQSVLPPF